MKKFSTLLLFLVVSSSTIFAQVKDRFEKKEKEEGSKVEQKSAEEIVEGKEDGQPGETNIWDKLVFGGNASLSIGSSTFVLLAPSVGYRFSDKLVAGPGYIYQYMKWNVAYDRYGNLVRIDGYENVIHGPKIFGTYFPFDRFFTGVQFEYLNHDLRMQLPNGRIETENRWTPVLFVEAGLKHNIGEKGFAVLGMRANVLHDITSPYASWIYPVIGFYF